MMVSVLEQCWEMSAIAAEAHNAAAIWLVTILSRDAWMTAKKMTKMITRMTSSLNQTIATRMKMLPQHLLCEVVAICLLQVIACDHQAE